MVSLLTTCRTSQVNLGQWTLPTEGLYLQRTVTTQGHASRSVRLWWWDHHDFFPQALQLIFEPCAPLYRGILITQNTSWLLYFINTILWNKYRNINKVYVLYFSMLQSLWLTWTQNWRQFIRNLSNIFCVMDRLSPNTEVSWRSSTWKGVH